MEKSTALFETRTFASLGSIADAVQITAVELIQAAFVAGEAPNLQTSEEDFSKPLPSTVTFVPPRSEPHDGSIDATTGRGLNRKSTPFEELKLAPPSVEIESVTVSRKPWNAAGTAGVEQTSVVEERYSAAVCGRLPKRHASRSVGARFVAVTVTTVPPSTGPDAGATLATIAGIV